MPSAADLIDGVERSAAARSTDFGICIDAAISNGARSRGGSFRSGSCGDFVDEVARAVSPMRADIICAGITARNC